MNKYPRKTIYAMTGVLIKEPTVICVGNTLERVKLERAILAHEDVTLFGKGKLTAVMEICDRLGLDYKISYGVEITDEECVRIYRWVSGKYAGIHLINDNENKSTYKGLSITLVGLNQRDMVEYTRLKGCPPILPLKRTKDAESEQFQIQKGLRDGFKTYIPNAELWIAENLYKSPGVTQLCAKIYDQKDEFYKLALLNMLRVKRPVALAYPKWVKMK